MRIRLVALFGLALACEGADAPLAPAPPAAPPSVPAPVATVGNIEIAVTTAGFDPDADGYAASLNLVQGGYGNHRGASLASNGTSTLQDFVPGDWRVHIYRLSRNCSVVGGDQKSVKVEAGRTTTLAVVVECVESGTIRVTTTTSGPDADENGYFLTDQETFANGEATGLPSNGTVTVSGLRPGDHFLKLSDVSPNCDVVAPLPQKTAVGMDTTVISIEIRCVAPTPIAVVMGNGSNSEIYLVKSNGLGENRLTSNDKADVNPAWSPDGRRIAFASDRTGNRDIFVMNEDGTDVVQLTVNGTADSHPAWSPDGARIAFVSDRDGNAEIYVMNADGTNSSRLTTNSVPDLEPAWSPDGTRIAFQSGLGVTAGLGIISVMNADGSGLRQLSSGQRPDTQPAWSPDGQMIAYTHSTGTGYIDIYAMNADGSGSARLTSDSNYHRANAAWSPDGGQIAFDDEDCWDYGPCPRGIMIYSRNGGGWSFFISDGAEPAWKPVR